MLDITVQALPSLPDLVQNPETPMALVPFGEGFPLVIYRPLGGDDRDPAHASRSRQGCRNRHPGPSHATPALNPAA
ncbi:MAG: hypothetical protein GDA49_02400 [Rhodospirillales bacterium]|nr:hypothetical protein [Rhodospirillales bacterium]